MGIMTQTRSVQWPPQRVALSPPCQTSESFRMFDPFLNFKFEPHFRGEASEFYRFGVLAMQMTEGYKC